MKKALVITLLFLLAGSGAAFAKDLDNVEFVDLSNNVVGTYFTDGTRLNFVISTGNVQGDRVYGTGNFTTAIFYKEIDGTISSASLITADPNSWDAATAFSGYTEI